MSETWLAHSLSLNHEPDTPTLRSSLTRLVAFHGKDILLAGGAKEIPESDLSAPRTAPTLTSQNQLSLGLGFYGVGIWGLGLSLGFRLWGLGFRAEGVKDGQG